MDKPIRKYILYKCRDVPNMKKKVAYLMEKKKEILEESGSVMDGQPRAKYTTSDTVGNKVVKLEKIDFKIKKLEFEIKTIEETRDLLDPFKQKVFDECIMKFCNLQAKADFYFMGVKQLVQVRGEIVRLIASRLGEYIDDNEF